MIAHFYETGEHWGTMQKALRVNSSALYAGIYPKYRYEEATATVATVKNGGIFYCIDGKYYTVTVKEKSSTSQQPWKNVLSYYANGTFLQEQIIPWMSYDDPCELTPIYTRYEN